MSLVRVRKRAEALLERFAMRGAPIDVHRVARELGLPIVIANLGDGVAGLLVQKPGALTVICVHEDDPPARQRFMIAHEIGHHHLGHDLKDDAQIHVDRGLVAQRTARSSEGVGVHQIEANQFAAALLMPAALIHARVEAIAQGALLDAHLSALAEEFQVSEQAMAIRLAMLDLV